MVALAAYFDDSKNASEGIFAVAGYLSTVRLWDESFAPAWWQALRDAPRPLKEFKTADCRHRVAEFAGWDSKDCTALTTSLVDVIVGPSIPNLVGIGAAVSIEDFGALQKDLQERFERFAYLLCGGVVVDAVFQLSERYVGDNDVRFVFDEQDELESKMRVVFKDLRAMASEEYAHKIQSPQFEPSERHAALQAADLLAYETYKEMKNRRENPPRKISAALQRLVDGKMHGARFFGRSELTEIGDSIRGGTHPHTGVYQLPTIYSSALEQKIRSRFPPSP